MSRAQYTGIGSYKCYCLLLILEYSSVFFTFASLAAYVCLGIYFLSQDYYIRDICSQSVLWEYVLLSIIFAGNKLSVYYLKKFTKKDYKFIKGVNLGSLIIEGILILLGGFGVFDYELACGNDNSNLWKFGIASFLLQIVYFFIAILISSSVFPTPEKTILLALIPALVAFSNSPADTTSAPDPIFFNSLSKFIFEFDFTEKHISGLVFLNVLLKL